MIQIHEPSQYFPRATQSDFVFSLLNGVKISRGVANTMLPEIFTWVPSNNGTLVALFLPPSSILWNMYNYRIVVLSLR